MRKLRHEEIPRRSTENVLKIPRHPITVLLDNIRSIHNVGSIFRTSDGAFIERIILGGITATPDHPQMHKTALGSQNIVPWNYEPDPLVAIDTLRQQGYKIVALELTDSPSPLSYIVPDHFPVCLMIGNELTGVDTRLLDQADFALEIPQYGAKQSLNVAVAYGIAVYQLIGIIRGSN